MIGLILLKELFDFETLVLYWVDCPYLDLLLMIWSKHVENVGSLLKIMIMVSITMTVNTMSYFAIVIEFGFDVLNVCVWA